MVAWGVALYEIGAIAGAAPAANDPFGIAAVRAGAPITIPDRGVSAVGGESLDLSNVLRWPGGLRYRARSAR